MPGRQDGSVPYNHPDSAAPLVKLRQAWKASYEADPTRCPKCISRSVKDAPEYDGEGVVCWTCGWSLETSATLLLRDKPSRGKTKIGNQHWRTRRTKLEAEMKPQYCIAGKHIVDPDTMEKDWRCGRCVNAANYARWTRKARR